MRAEDKWKQAKVHSAIDGQTHKDIEGIVWHHPDGRMVKIKKKDFGYKW
jgi:hypothetical protein